MIKYKLTNQQMQTYRNFQWVLEEKRAIQSPGKELCSNKVFHYYASPEQAVLFNPIHANIEKPRLFEVEIDKEVAFDGLKGGCHEMTLKRELALPDITIEQRVAFAIRVALKVYSEPNFVKWGKDWLSGRDRSAEARAAWAAETAARVARVAAEARAAVWAAWAAETAEAAGAARVAAEARAAAWAAETAARVAETARVAAEARAAVWAAWAAETAARVAETAVAGSTQIDFQSIIEEVLNANI